MLGNNLANSDAPAPGPLNQVGVNFMAKTKILLAEDHTILREGVRALLSTDPDMEIIGEVENGQDAQRLASQLTPDLILMDLTMPRSNGTEAISAIKRRNPEIKIIALTVHKTEEYIRAALDAGASGYVLKDDSHQDLLQAIRNVLRGRVYLSPGIADRVVTGFLDQRSGQPDTSAPRSWDLLTAREREIIKLIAEGNKNKTIAEYLSVSTKTVEKHRSNLMQKLNLHNASALTAYAFEHGLVGNGKTVS